MNIERIPILESQAIQEFITKYSDCAFNSPDWCRVLQDGFNSEVLCYCLKDSEKLKLVLPGILLDFKIIKIFYSNIPYGGFIGEQEYVLDFLPLLEKVLKKEGVHMFRLTKKINDNYHNFLGYKLQRGCQQIINIDGLSEQGLWLGYRKRVRRDIRRAEKLGVQVKEISDRKDIEILYQLYQETMKRNNSFTVWTKKAFYSIYDNLVLKGEGNILFADVNNKHIAGIILIYSSDTLFYFMNASSTDYLTFCPNDLLLHRTIISGIKTNKKYVDLMTSRESDVELIKFKEKWGSRNFPFFILEKDLSFIRVKIWNILWAMVNSKLITPLIRVFH